MTLISWKYIIYSRGGYMVNSVLLRRFFATGIDSIYFIPGAIILALFENLLSLIIMFSIFNLRDAFSERSFG